jgi:hypothetical protein
MAHLLRHPALDHVAFYLETPRMEQGYAAVTSSHLPTFGPQAISVGGARTSCLDRCVRGTAAV